MGQNSSGDKKKDRVQSSMKKIMGLQVGTLSNALCKKKVYLFFIGFFF